MEAIRRSTPVMTDLSPAAERDVTVKVDATC